MIEFSRYIPFGQYVNNGSRIANLDPRTKLVGALLLVAAISYISRVPAFLLCLAFCLLLQQMSRISLLYVLRSLRPFAILLLFALVFEVLFYVPNNATPLLWHWWVLSISWEGIFLSLLGLARVIFLYYLVAMLTFTTSLVDLTDGLEVLLAPLQKIGIPTNAFVMVLVIAFKFVPIFVGELERLMKAQAARGMRFGEGNLVQRVAKLASLLVPLFASAFKRVKTLSVALEARCFGGSKGWQRSKRRLLQFQRVDIFSLVLTTVVVVALVAINLISPW
ncbi:MAG TPA: energy-coupling factor transporter transmembrane component T [Ktedonobacteraceae bacterium]